MDLGIREIIYMALDFVIYSSLIVMWYVTIDLNIKKILYEPTFLENSIYIQKNCENNLDYGRCLITIKKELLTEENCSNYTEELKGKNIKEYQCDINSKTISYYYNLNYLAKFNLK